MQKISDTKILYSPSDLVHFLSCNHSTVLDIKNFTQAMEKAEESSINKLLQDKGLKHEAEYLERLRGEGKSIVEIPKNIKLQERAELTLEALKSGVDIVFQGVLLKDNWRGDADFLIKVSMPSNFGNFSYEVLDTKLARHADPKHIIQLCVYTDLITNLQGTLPKKMHLFLGDQSLLTFNTQEFFYYYQHAKYRFETFVTNVPTDSAPEPCQYCQFCKWKDNCKNQWQREDHLSLVANIQRSQIDKLRHAGVNTVAALATLSPDNNIADINDEVLGRLHAQASLQIHKRTTGEDKCEIIPFPEGKGFHRLPFPDDGDLFFDMEGDPLHPNGLEYLFGIYYAKKDEHVFVPFWAHNHDEERVAFGQFMKFLEDHLTEFPNAHIYHYNHYETTALKRLACRYAVAEEQLDNLLRQKKFVDLFKVVRESLRISEEAYSLKNFETFYMDKRSGAVATAGDSIVVYNEWRETQEMELLHQIAEYNELDCISTYKLREWLLTKRPELSVWFQATDAQGNEPAKERKDWEIEYEQFQERLFTDTSNIAKELRERMVHLLEFHNREGKPQWWALFERTDKFEDEIIDDNECLGGLILTGTAPEKRSIIYTYKFPPQEYKLRPGSSVVNVNTTQSAGTITELNEDQGIVRIKREAKRESLPGKLNIGPGSPVGAAVIRAAIYRVADNMLNGSGKYNAVLDLLGKLPPKIIGKSAGDHIIAGDNLQQEAIQAVAKMDNSYLFIQGPPGAGKTHTSGHMIIELMRQGKRVGVAANSHKAIHNLLHKIEQVAEEQSFRFTGVKKCSADIETIYDGVFIKSVDKIENMNMNAQLLAGTAWLFSDERLDQHLDYLFIDEAGQVSVANVIAMGSAAKNIVLVGDQMQLGQPIQGVHPGEAGLSILEFLLGNNATIPPDRGIFLDNTRRLHPSICQFVSDAFYDGRLEADKGNIKRKLVFDASMLEIPSEGIKLIPAEHTGCSQKSVEEGVILKEKYQALLTQKFQDKDGSIRGITMEDILVVTPYNVQVNYLKSIMPEGARVGTVDKFQGQEALIVLISMVTSSAEDLPRNIEFLYSKNRLNVAISRAQCLAIIVANPKLLEVPCKTVGQMQLVNTLCWLAEFAE